MGNGKNGRSDGDGVMTKIRTFIAAELPEEVKVHLASVSEVLAQQLPPGAVRWVKPEQIHLTLRFLGDTAVDQLPAITSALDEAMGRQAPFTLYLDELGCFPNRKRPRVIWAGLSGEEAAVARLKRAIDECLVPLGWERETRPFQPHLTLGRVKDVRKLARVEWGTLLKHLAMPLAAVYLIESQLTPQGPIYMVRHTSRLGSM